MNTKIRYGLSAAVLALIGAGASAPQILDQFLDEKEGNHTMAYRDGSGIWTICRGATVVDGKTVFPNMKLSKEKCDQVNAIERDKALAWGADKPLSNLQNGQMVKIRQNASGVVTGLTIDTGNNQQVLFTRQPDGSFIRAR